MYKQSLYALAHVSGNALQVLTFQRQKLIKDVPFPFRLTVFQPLLGAVLLLHSMLLHTRKRTPFRM